MKGYVVFAHGSSVESANEAVRVVTAQLRERGGYEAVEAAFLEGGKPDFAVPWNRWRRAELRTSW